MEINMLGFKVTNENKKFDAQKDCALPVAVMDDIHGYALFMLDQDGRVVRWNQGAVALLGYRAEEIIGQHFSFLYDSQEMQLHHMSQFCLGIAAKEGIYENRGWWVRRGQPNFFAQVIVMPVAENGCGFVVMAWDISKSKAAAANVQEPHRNLPLDD
jgi:osomolarity two-component system, sensor histidine kinase TcsA